MTRIRASLAMFFAVLTFPFLAFAASFEAPADWERLGTVEQWARMDSHFHRVTGMEGATELQVYDFEQRPVYAATLEPRTGLRRLPLPEFLALDESEQEQRRQEARRQLKYVVDFRARVNSLISDVRFNYTSGWGQRPTDHRVVGDVLGRLQEAVGLDPTHVYAWHLLSYFRTNCGDRWRALDALDGAEAALRMLPPGSLPQVRRRIALDRAWILRELGFGDEALQRVESAEKLAPPDRETVLLRGLLAARAGDYRTATRIAGELAATPVHLFPTDWDPHAQATLRPAILDPLAWPTRSSPHLKAWILALLWLHEGERDLAWKVFPDFSLDRHYLNGSRFCNEAAAIYEATGRPHLAARFWSAAHRYVPYTPYMVYVTYGADLEPFTGRRGAVPAALAYDTHRMAGSRLGRGIALLGQAAAAQDPAERADLAQRSILELEICRRTSWETAATELALAYAQAILGDPEATLQAATAALAALDPQRDRNRYRRAEQLREAALRTAPDLPSAVDDDLPATAFETPEQTEARLRALYEENPGDRAARRDLARWLIRHGDVDQGERLLEPLLPPRGEPETADWLAALELDRQRNDAVRARQMLQALLEGRAANWPDPDLWATVGILCTEHGIEQGTAALRYALELDPDNQGLRDHLSATGK